MPGISCADYLVRWCPAREALENDEVDSDDDFDEEAAERDHTQHSSSLGAFHASIALCRLISIHHAGLLLLTHSMQARMSFRLLRPVSPTTRLPRRPASS